MKMFKGLRGCLRLQGLLLTINVVSSCNKETKQEKALSNFMNQVSTVIKVDTNSYINSYTNEFTKLFDTSNGFNSVRKFIDENTFVDYGVLGSNETSIMCSILFKKQGNKWLVFDGSSWAVFFDGEKLHKVYLEYSDIELEPQGKYEIGDEFFFSFEYRYRNSISFDIVLHFFNPSKGIVLIRTDGSDLRRTDFNQQISDSLSDRSRIR
jgi:hypothetical protein